MFRIESGLKDGACHHCRLFVSVRGSFPQREGNVEKEPRIMSPFFGASLGARPDMMR